MRYFSVALLALVAVCGCNIRNKEKLIDSLRAYNDAVRWRMAQRATQYLRGKAKMAFVNSVEQRGDVRVTHYQIQHVKLIGSERAIVIVRFNWYSELRGRVHRTVMTQHWASKGSWHITDQRWVRGPTLPLLARAPVASRKNARRGLTGPRKTP